MGKSPPLRNQLRADLTDNQWVTLTAVGLALVALLAVSLRVGPFPVADIGPSFLLALSVMDTTFVYSEHWPVTYTPWKAVSWTIAVGVVTAGVFLGMYGITETLPEVNPTVGAAVAFLTTVGLQLATAVLYGWAR